MDVKGIYVYVDEALRELPPLAVYGAGCAIGLAVGYFAFSGLANVQAPAGFTAKGGEHVPVIPCDNCGEDGAAEVAIASAKLHALNTLPSYLEVEKDRISQEWRSAMNQRNNF